MIVSANGVGLIKPFEGKPRMTARVCEGGAWEVGYGCTYYPNGSRVKAGDTITEDMVEPMLAHCMAVELAPVIRVLDREPSQNWIDAFASFAYNNGGHNVAREADAVRKFNEYKDFEAAAAFVGWISATSNGPTLTETRDPFYDAVWEERGGARVWIDADGKPCEYRRKMRGLLRRRLAEGCVALGYHWEQAAANDAVFLQRERHWRNGRWEDRVISMTQLKDILPVAKKYPLAVQSSPTIAQQPDPPKAPAPVIEVKAEPLPEILPPVPVPKPAPKEKPVTTPPAPQPKLPDDFDPNDGFKAMVYSRRFWGWLLIILGRFSFVTDAGAGTLAQTGGVVGQFANSIAGDPLLLDAYTGFAVMMTGEAVRWWGEKKATRALK